MSECVGRWFACKKGEGTVYACLCVIRSCLPYLWWEELEEQYGCDDHTQDGLGQAANEPGGPRIRNNHTWQEGVGGQGQQGM